MNLSLRTRLLTGVAVIAVVQVMAAAAVISITSSQILDQVDDRLVVGADAVDGNGRERIDRISDLYQGVVTANGELLTLNSFPERGRVAPTPKITPAAITAAGGAPFTVEAERGQDEYRALAVEAGDGSWFVVAGLLDGYEWTINRLIRAIAIATGVVGLVLGAVTWWMLRLGINPVKRMTSTAEAIAVGDLSERIENTHPGTEVGQLGLALNTMMGQIERSFGDRTRAEERLRQFIADASHELRTPVATIRGYAELYQVGGLDEAADLDDAMRRTGEESERMSRLIADMLNLAKLDRDPTVDARPVDLAALMLDAAADATARHPHRAVQTDLPIDAVVEGDEDLLRQAMSNVVSNAMVHTIDAAVSISITTKANQTEVRVSDNGPGMSADAVRRATERFYRADPSRSRHQGGSGLGLAIVDSIVEAHHGELHIDSTPDHGTTVTITLPTPPAADSRPAHGEFSGDSEVRSPDSTHEQRQSR